MSKYIKSESGLYIKKWTSFDDIITRKTPSQLYENFLGDPPNIDNLTNKICRLYGAYNLYEKSIESKSTNHLIGDFEIKIYYDFKDQISNDAIIELEKLTYGDTRTYHMDKYWNPDVCTASVYISLRITKKRYLCHEFSIQCYDTITETELSAYQTLHQKCNELKKKRNL